MVVAKVYDPDAVVRLMVSPDPWPAAGRHVTAKCPQVRMVQGRPPTMTAFDVGPKSTPVTVKMVDTPSVEMVEGEKPVMTGGL